MRSNLTRTLAITTALVVTGVGLSACVSNSSYYDGNPRYSYDQRYRDGYKSPRYGYNDRYEGRRWVDRDGDGRRDWWEYRR